MQVNVDKNDDEFDIDEFVKNTATKMLKEEKSEENSDISIISIFDSDTSNHTVKLNQYIELETLESGDGATAHSISNREHEGIPILNESIDNKQRQIMVFTWSRNKFDVKDISNGKQRILEVHMPTNNKDLIKTFLKEYVDLKHKYFIYFETSLLRNDFSEVVTQLYKMGTLNLIECTERVVNLTQK